MRSSILVFMALACPLAAQWRGTAADARRRSRSRADSRTADRGRAGRDRIRAFLGGQRRQASRSAGHRRHRQSARDGPGCVLDHARLHDHAQGRLDAGISGRARSAARNARLPARKSRLPTPSCRPRATKWPRATADAWVRYAATTTPWSDCARSKWTWNWARAPRRRRSSRGARIPSEALAADASVTELKSRMLQLRGDLRRERVRAGALDWSRRRWRRRRQFRRWMNCPRKWSSLRASVHQHVSLRPLDAQVAVSRRRSSSSRKPRVVPAGAPNSATQSAGPTTRTWPRCSSRVDLPLFARHRQNPVVAARGADLRRAQAEREAELRMHQAEFEQMLAPGRPRASS